MCQAISSDTRPVLSIALSRLLEPVPVILGQKKKKVFEVLSAAMDRNLSGVTLLIHVAYSSWWVLPSILIETVFVGSPKATGPGQW